jgi:hypothetical protein
MIWHRLHTPLIGALWYFRRKLLTLLRNRLPLAAAAGGPSPQADIVPHYRFLRSGNAEI